MQETPTSIRIPDAFLDRAEALIPKLNKLPDFAAIGPVTRHKVLRLAVARGLEALESEMAQKRARRNK